MEDNTMDDKKISNTEEILDAKERRADDASCWSVTGLYY